jgi:ABC-type proline/glycine betaine transport system substrate-binding protein
VTFDDLFFGSQRVASFSEATNVHQTSIQCPGRIMNCVIRQVKRTPLPRHLGYHTEITVLSAAVSCASMKKRDIGVFPI